MNQDSCFTTTTVAFDPHLKSDQIILNHQHATGDKTNRVSQHLDHIRKLARITTKAKVSSVNSFPTGAGIASSASGFAALTLAATAATGLKLSSTQLSAIARLGSGSAARSIPSGFVIWKQGHSHLTSSARSLFPPSHWPLIDIVCVVSSGEKSTSSTNGHKLAPSSPYFKLRLKQLPYRLTQVKQALKTKNLKLLGEIIEQETIDLHLIAMSSQPPIFYWEPATLQLIKLLPTWRNGGLPVYFTLDAGPNPHLITEQKYQSKLFKQLRHFKFIQQLIVNRVGEGAKLIPNPRS